MFPRRIGESPQALFTLAAEHLKSSRKRDLLVFLPGPVLFSGPRLLAEIERLASSLTRFALPHGARILLRLHHPLALPVVLPALWSRGFVPILTEGNSPKSERVRLAEYFAPDALLEESEEDMKGGETLFVPPLPLLHLRPWEGGDRLSLPKRTILVRTTSGSSGVPRGVALSGSQALADAHNIITSLRLSPASRTLAAIPMGHAYGFSTLLTPLLFFGIPMILLERPLPELFRKALGRYPALFFPGIPLLFQLLLSSSIRPRFLRKLHPCISAGAALPAHTALRFRERAAEPVRNFYGASECGAITYDRSAAGAAPPGCVGTPLAGVRLSVAGRRWVTPSTGGEAPRGRIVVEGRAVALGYVRAGVRPRPFHRKFLTGDLGRIDGSGRLFLEGRLDQMINVGGRKVFPAEVERVLGSAPGVREVAILGMPDPLRGEVVAAVVACTGDVTPEDLIAFCRERLAAYRVPRRIEILPVIPRTARGKVDTARLRSLLAAR